MRVLILCLSAIITFSAGAFPKIHIEKINGFEVHFVDIGRGALLKNVSLLS